MSSLQTSNSLSLQGLCWSIATLDLPPDAEVTAFHRFLHQLPLAISVFLDFTVSLSLHSSGEVLLPCLLHKRKSAGPRWGSTLWPLPHLHPRQAADYPPRPLGELKPRGTEQQARCGSVSRRPGAQLLLPQPPVDPGCSGNREVSRPTWRHASSAATDTEGPPLSKLSRGRCSCPNSYQRPSGIQVWKIPAVSKPRGGWRP